MSFDTAKGRNLLESYLRGVPFDSRAHALVLIAAGNLTDDLPGQDATHGHVFGKTLRQLMESVHNKIALRKAALQLLEQDIEQETERRVAKELTRTLNVPAESLVPHPPGIAHLIFEGDSPIDSDTFAEFWTLFNAAYALCSDMPLDEVEGLPHAVSRQERAKVAAAAASDAEATTRDLEAGLRHAVSRQERAKVAAAAASDTKEATTRDLEARLRHAVYARAKVTAASSIPVKSDRVPFKIVGIHKASSLQVWMVALTSALAGAVILSGGQVDLLGMRFELRPIGDGLARLKTLFKPSKSVSAIKRKSRSGRHDQSK